MYCFSEDIDNRTVYVKTGPFLKLAVFLKVGPFSENVENWTVFLKILEMGPFFYT